MSRLSDGLLAKFPRRPLGRRGAAVADRAAAADGRLVGSGVKVHFDGVKAVDGVSIEIGVGEVLGLIGPNGAGKTTLVNALTGFTPVTAGSVKLDSVSLAGRPPHAIARHGVARTFQGARFLPRLDLIENVEVGPVGLGASRRKARPRALAALRAVGLAGKLDRRPDALSHGEERRLGIARAIAMSPRFILLDEPAAGLNESEGRELVKVIRALPEEGRGVLLIEHDMDVVMSACDEIQVLDHGLTIARGTPAEVRRDPAVIAAYLGDEADAGIA